MRISPLKQTVYHPFCYRVNHLEAMHPYFVEKDQFVPLNVWAKMLVMGWLFIALVLSVMWNAQWIQNVH